MPQQEFGMAIINMILLALILGFCFLLFIWGLDMLIKRLINKSDLAYKTKHDELRLAYDKAYNYFLYCPDSEREKAHKGLKICRNRYFQH